MHAWHSKAFLLAALPLFFLRIYAVFIRFFPFLRLYAAFIRYSGLPLLKSDFYFFNGLQLFQRSSALSAVFRFAIAVFRSFSGCPLFQRLSAFSIFTAVFR